MSEMKFSTMGLEFPLTVPDTEADFDKLATKPGACLKEAIMNVVYRGVLPTIRSRFIVALEKATGIKQPTEQKKDDKGQPVKDEKGAPVMVASLNDGAYIKLVRTTKKWTDEAQWTTHGTPILLAAIAGDKNATDEDEKKPIVFDPTAAAREAKPKKLPQEYLDSAIRVFTNGNQHKILDRLRKESDGTVTVEYVKEPKHDDPTFAAVRAGNIERLGWALRANLLYINRKQQESYA